MPNTNPHLQVDAAAEVASSASEGFLIPNQGVHFAFVVTRTIRLWLTIMIATILSSLGGLMPLFVDGGAPAVIALVIVVAVVILFTAILALWSYLAWRRFSWEVTLSELNIYSGVIFRKNEHIPITRIHSIDHKQTLVERLLGVVEVKIITASGSPQREAKIEGITLAEAENLSRAIFAQKRVLEETSRSSSAPATAAEIKEATKAALAGASSWMTDTPGALNEDLAHSVARTSESLRGVFGGAAAESDEVHFEHRLSTKDLLLTGLSNSNVLYFVLIIPMILIGFLADLGYAGELFNYVVQLGVVLGLILMVAFLIIGWVISVSHALLVYGGFTVRRRSGRIEVEHGILEKRSIGISMDRVQSVRVKRGPLRRIIGYAEITVDTVLGLSTEGEINKAAIVHPFIKADKVDEFLSELLPEFADHPVPETPLPKRALWRLLFRSTFWVTLFVLVPAIITAFVGANYWQDYATTGEISVLVTTVFILALCIFCGTMLFRARKWGVNESMIGIQKGLLSRDVIYIAKRKVQWVRISQSWFQKRRSLVSLRLLTAAGGPGGGTASRIIDIDSGEGDTIAEWAWPPLRQSADSEVQ